MPVAAVAAATFLAAEIGSLLNGVPGQLSSGPGARMG